MSGRRVRPSKVLEASRQLLTLKSIQLSIYAIDNLTDTSASFAAKGLLDYDHPDIPALLVAAHLLEGPSGLFAQRKLLLGPASG